MVMGLWDYTPFIIGMTGLITPGLKLGSWDYTFTGLPLQGPISSQVHPGV